MLSLPVNDLYDKGVDNKDLIVINEANKDITAQVKIGKDISEEFNIPGNILAGDTLGPTIATTHMDSIPQEWEKDDQNTKFKYRNEVSVNFVGMIDDLTGISYEGADSIKMNAYVNVRTAEKNLQYNVTKSKKLV